jgi:hypothetical protein
MKDKPNRFFSTSISAEQAKDSGMALVLILLLFAVFTNDDLYLKIAIAALLVNMIFPRFYYPFAIFWFGLANLLGSVVSKVLLSVVYLVVVMPVALVRQLAGKDPLRLGDFRKGHDSVMKKRNHLYRPEDLEKPF